MGITLKGASSIVGEFVVNPSGLQRHGRDRAHILALVYAVALFPDQP